MRIEIDKYIVVSDPQCMWIEEKYTGKNGKEYTRRVSGYVRTFKELLEKINRSINATIIMVTHDSVLVEKYKKRTIVLDNGYIVHDSSQGGYKSI